MINDHFNDAYQWLCQGGYIQNVDVPIGEDEWLLKNIHLMRRLKYWLADRNGDGGRLPIDDYTRGMFVWGVYANEALG